MAKTAFDLSNELLAHQPRLGYPLAQSFIARAWRDIRDARLWSFDVAEGVLEAAQLTNSGSVTLTQFSPTVTPDATAQAAFLAFGLNPPITACQFRLTSGPLYNITAIDSTSGALTLDRPYYEASGNGVAYLIYRAYFTPPPSLRQPDGTYDFLRFLSVTDFLNVFDLDLTQQKATLDLLDPQRGSFGPPTCLADYKADSLGNPLYEMWPHPQIQQGFLALCQRRGTEITTLNASTFAFPQAIPPDLIICRAKYRAYEWAEANKGLHPELRATNWTALMQATQVEYQGRPRTGDVGALGRAIRQDEETFLQTFIPTALSRRGGSRWPWPISGTWLQQHDLGIGSGL